MLDICLHVRSSNDSKQTALNHISATKLGQPNSLPLAPTNAYEYLNENPPSVRSSDHMKWTQTRRGFILINRLSYHMGLATLAVYKPFYNISHNSNRACWICGIVLNTEIYKIDKVNIYANKNASITCFFMYHVPSGWSWISTTSYHFSFK